MASDFRLPAWHSAAPAGRRRSSATVFIGVAFSVLFIVFVTLFYTPVLRSLAQLTSSVCHAQDFKYPYYMTEHLEYLDLSPAGDVAWNSLFTENGAYLYRQMPSGPNGEDEIRLYGISMFHQLHCLSMIRLQLQAMNASMHGETLPSSGHHHDLRDKHWLHCLDYLRQAVLCNADDTIEAPKRHPKDATKDFVNGNGQRMCRDSARLYDWATLSGPSMELREQLLAEGEDWPEPEGIEWPEPLE